jgi:hypothetical protein
LDGAVLEHAGVHASRHSGDRAKPP